MLLNIPVYHTIKAREKGYRTFYNHSVYTVAEFDVPYVAETDAPVALVYSHKGQEFDIEVRYHDGRFWHPEMAASQTLDPEEWAEMLPRTGRDHKDNSGDPRGWGILSESRQDTMRSVEFDDDTFRAVEKSDFEEKRASLAAYLDRSVRIIAGQVWFEVPEPRYFLARTRSYREASSEIVFGMPPAKKTPYLYEKVLPEGDFFRIDRFDDMRAHVADNFKRMEGNLPQEARILLQGIYEFHDEEASLLSMSKTLRKDLKPHLADMDAPSGKAWFDFRDALRETGQDSDADVYERLAGTLSVLVEALDSAVPEKDEHEYWHKDAVSVGRATLARWQMRPLDFSYEFAP